MYMWLSVCNEDNREVSSHRDNNVINDLDISYDSLLISYLAETDWRISLVKFNDRFIKQLLQHVLLFII